MGYFLTQSSLEVQAFLPSIMPCLDTIGGENHSVGQQSHQQQKWHHHHCDNDDITKCFYMFGNRWSSNHRVAYQLVQRNCHAQSPLKRRTCLMEHCLDESPFISFPGRLVLRYWVQAKCFFFIILDEQIIFRCGVWSS